MKKVYLYLLFTFGIAWTLFGVAIAATGALDIAAAGTSPFAASAVLATCAGAAMFCPLVGALLTKLALRKTERIDLMVRPNIRGNQRFYLAAWLLPAALSVAGAVLFYAVFRDAFDPTLQAYVARTVAQLEALGMPAAELETVVAQIDAQLAPGMLAAICVFAVLGAPFINMIPAFGEEAGWRGLLYPALAERMGARRAVLVTGLVWGVWHAPMTIVGHNYGVGYWGYPVTGILAMCVFCVAVSACLAWLTLHARSVWPAALTHGAINAVANLGTLFYAGSTFLLGPSPAGLLAGVPVVLLAAVCWARLPARPKQSIQA